MIPLPSVFTVNPKLATANNFEYAKGAHMLASELCALPTHCEGVPVGWWCGYSDQMKELLKYLTEPPEGPQQRDILSKFRCSLSVQLQMCHTCIRIYHNTVAAWQENMEGETRRRSLKRIRDLVEWDVARIEPVLTSFITRASRRQDGVLNKQLLSNAIFECLLSFRLCLHPSISTILAELFKLSSPVSSNDLSEFIREHEAIPSGLLALCFHSFVAVRTWAQRMYCGLVATYKPDSSALEYLLVKAVRQIGRSGSQQKSRHGGAASVADGDTAAWEGLAFIFALLEKRELQSFAELLEPGELLKYLLLGLQDSRETVVCHAVDCILLMMEAMSFTSLFQTKSITADELLDILFHSIEHKYRGRIGKEKLLLVIAPVLSRASASCSKSSVCRLYRKGFNFLNKNIRRNLENEARIADVLSGTNITESKKELKSFIRTGASLLTWFYTYTAPRLPFDDVDVICDFVITVIREDPEGESGWYLFRAVLLTDVINLIRSVKSGRDARLIGKTFLMKRPSSIALRPEESEIMERVINASEMGSITWLGSLWEKVKDGKHLKRRGNTLTVPAMEVNILLDLHRLIGMIDTSCVRWNLVEGQKGATYSNSMISPIPCNNNTFIRECVNTIQATIGIRFAEACSGIGDQIWWKQLPFHATHLLASAQEKIANNAFEALLKSQQLYLATCVGARSKLLAHFLKSNSDIASTTADGCVSSMRIISALGPVVSIRTYVRFLLWYRVLLESRYVALLEIDKSNWALGVILTFVQSWKWLERITDGTVFREVCCRFFSNLRDIWRQFAASVSARVHQTSDLAETHEAMVTSVLRGLLSMDGLQDTVICGSWICTVSSLAAYWKDVIEFRKMMIMFIKSQVSTRNKYTADQCRLLARKADLNEVEVALDRWAREEPQIPEVEYAKSGGENRIGECVLRQARETASIDRPVEERRILGSRTMRKSSVTRSILASGVVKPTPHMRAFTKLHFKDTRISSMRRDAKAAMKESRKLPLMGKIKRNFEGGKTKFELLVEEKRAERVNRLSTRKEKKNPEVTLMEEHLLNARQNRTDDAGKLSNTMGKFGKGLLSLPLAYRRLEARHIEIIYRDILSTNVATLSGDSLQNLETSHKHPGTFEDVESYVKYWEPLIVSEFSSCLRKKVQEEDKFAEKDRAVTDYRSCRHLFIVDGPVESVGYVQHISLRFCNLRQFASAMRSTAESDFNVFSGQATDIVLLLIPRVDKSSESLSTTTSFALALGLITKIEKKGSEFSIRLSVSFPHCGSAPTNGRQIRVSRLTSISTFQRQIEGLWSLTTLSDGVLWPILQPRVGLQVNKDVVTKQRLPLEKVAAPRVNFARDLQSNGFLNGSQAGAVIEVLNACAPIFCPRHLLPVSNSCEINHGSLTLIQGPPGTGKTSTIIGLLSAMLLREGNRRIWRRAKVFIADEPTIVRLAPIRVLVCAPSNSAVDELMLRVMKQGLHTKSGHRMSPRLVRVGGGTTMDCIRRLEIRRLSEHGLNFVYGKRSAAESARHLQDLLGEMAKLKESIDAIVQKRREHQNVVDEMEAKRGCYDNESRRNAATLRQLSDRLSALLAKKKELGAKLEEGRAKCKTDDMIRKREKIEAKCRLLNSSSIVFATLSSSGNDDLKNLSAKFDAVIVDEAAQCGEPEILIPITGCRSSSGCSIAPSHVVLVGDPKQLPATVISTDGTVAKALGRSLFERIVEVSSQSVHMLNTQYRMHPQISSFPNLQFYSGKLQDGSNVLSEDMARCFHRDSRNRFGPLTFLDTSRSKANEIRNENGSLCNELEARVISCAIIALMKNHGFENVRGKIVILTPYRQQVVVLKRLVEEKKVLRTLAIEVNTIDGIQGRENSIVFLSTVRSWNARGIGFLDDERRLNVAITRAKHALVIVGNATILARHSKLWSSHISHCRTVSALSSLPEDLNLFFPEALCTLVQGKESDQHNNISSGSAAEVRSINGSDRLFMRKPSHKFEAVERGIRLRSSSVDTEDKNVSLPATNSTQKTQFFMGERKVTDTSPGTERKAILLPRRNNQERTKLKTGGAAANNKKNKVLSHEHGMVEQERRPSGKIETDTGSDHISFVGSGIVKQGLVQTTLQNQTDVPNAMVRDAAKASRARTVRFSFDDRASSSKPAEATFHRKFKHGILAVNGRAVSPRETAPGTYVLKDLRELLSNNGRTSAVRSTTPSVKKKEWQAGQQAVAVQNVYPVEGGRRLENRKRKNYDSECNRLLEEGRHMKKKREANNIEKEDVYKR